MFERLQFSLAFLVAIILVGCAGQGPKVTPLARQTVPPLAPSESLPEARPAEPAPVELPVVTPAPAPVALSGWISLKKWADTNNISAPRIKVSSTETNVELKGDLGTFVFEPPRRNARWNDTLVGVGFPLQFTNREPYIHAIDLAKVVEPLMLTNAPRKTNGIVVIDAGHGGANSGAISRDRKIMEKELTLDWALRIEKLLEGTGWKAILTRPVDVDLALTQRVAFAEMQKADLFISLHFNSFSNPREAGIESYCLTPQGMNSHVTRDFPDELGSFFPNNNYDVENLLLAHDLHRSILKHTNRKDRGVRRARFMTVLREQNRPAVLLEGGYLSNPEEAKLISTPEYRQKLAEAVVEVLGVQPRTLTSLRE